MVRPKKEDAIDVKPARWDITGAPLRWKELPAIKDDLGNELVITADPELDAQLKAAIELMVNCYSQKGKLQDVAICEKVSTPEHKLTLHALRNWLRNPKFQNYYKLLLKELAANVETHTLRVAADVLEIITRQVGMIKQKQEDDDEPMSLRKLQMLSGLIKDLQKSSGLVMTGNVVIDARRQTINQGGDSGQMNTKLLPSADIVSKRLQELQSHIDGLKGQMEPDIIDAEVEESGDH